MASIIRESRQIYAVGRGVLFRVMSANLQRDGSVYIAILRSDGIVPLRLNPVSFDKPLPNTRTLAEPGIETRISIHPTPSSTVNHMIKTHVVSSKTRNNIVYLSNSIKQHDEFIPLGLIGTGAFRDKHVINRVDETFHEVMRYDPANFQLRTFVFVSNVGKVFPNSLREPDMNYTSIHLGEFKLHFICTLWPYPSTGDGVVETMATTKDKGPHTHPWTAEGIMYVMRTAVQRANENLKTYLPSTVLPRHGFTIPKTEISWNLVNEHGNSSNILLPWTIVK